MGSEDFNEDLLNRFEGVDETLIEPEDVVEEISNALKPLMDKELREIGNVWIQLGLPASLRNERIDEIVDLLKEVLVHSREVEEKSLEKMIKYKDTRFEEVNEMLAALHLSSYTLPSDMSLFALGKLLRNKYDELKKVKDERMEKLMELDKKKVDTCAKLGERPPKFDLKTSIPSDEELMQLQSIVTKELTELRKRRDQYATVKQAIDELVAELEFEPTNNFERELFQGEDKFILSKSNINKLIELHNNLQDTNEKNIILKKNMFDRLNYLWDRLEVEEGVRDEIMSSYVLNSKKTLDALQSEQVEKYEQMRKERIGEFIQNIIPETEGWWERCCVSEEEQENLKIHLDQMPKESEELLEAWERELKYRKEFYAEHESTFNDIETLYEAWDELLEIEKSEKDPDRYKNRKIPSTQIMKEQQRKRRLEAQIKKIEKDLSGKSDALAENGASFTIGGTDLKEYVMSRRVDYEAAKENEKHMKKVSKQLEIAKEMYGGKLPKGGIVVRKSPVKRLGTYAVNSPGSPTKLRRMNQGNLSKRMGPPSATNSRPGTATKSRNATILKPRSAQGTPLPPSVSQQSLMSLNEEEFQEGLKQRKARCLNSTYVRTDLERLRF